MHDVFHSEVFNSRDRGKDLLSSLTSMIIVAYIQTINVYVCMRGNGSRERDRRGQNKMGGGGDRR